MNVSSSALLLGKASQVLPSEKDIPSFPSIDLKKKRKQAKPAPSLPPSALNAQQRRRQSRAVHADARSRAAAAGQQVAAAGVSFAAGWKEGFLWPRKKAAAAAEEEEGKAASSSSSSSRRSVAAAGMPAAAAAAGAGAATTTGELRELLALCQQIESDCLQQQQQQKEDEIKQGEDEFEAIKYKIEEILRNTRFLIDARQDIRAKKGTTLESVRLGGEIYDNITLLRELFQQLSAAYSRLFKLRKKLHLSDEHLEQRHAEVCKMLRLIEEIRRENQRTAVGLRKGVGDGLSRYKTLTQLQQSQRAEGGDRRRDGKENVWGAEAAAAAARGDTMGRQSAAAEVISEEDLAVVRRWRERDAEFDQQVEEIGNAIDRIANVTAKIGEKADVQRELLQKVHQQTSKTTAELQHVTEKVKEVMGKQSNMRFFTRLLLIVILLFLVCFVLSIIYSRYIKN